VQAQATSATPIPGPACTREASSVQLPVWNVALSFSVLKTSAVQLSGITTSQALASFEETSPASSIAH